MRWSTISNRTRCSYVAEVRCGYSLRAAPRRVSGGTDGRCQQGPPQHAPTIPTRVATAGQPAATGGSHAAQRRHRAAAQITSCGSLTARRACLVQWWVRWPVVVTAHGRKQDRHAEIVGGALGCRRTSGPAWVSQRCCACWCSSSPWAARAGWRGSVPRSAPVCARSARRSRSIQRRLTHVRRGGSRNDGSNAGLWDRRWHAVSCAVLLRLERAMRPRLAARRLPLA